MKINEQEKLEINFTAILNFYIDIKGVIINSS